MTPSELNTIIRERYNAVGDSFFSDSYIYSGLYQAQMELALNCRLIERTYSTTSTSGTREYSYPSTAMSIRRVEYNGVKVLPVDLIDDPKTSVTEPSGTPAEYAIWGQEIVFFPTPDTTGDTIKVFSYDRPSTVSVTSTLDVPEKYHLALIDYVMFTMFAKEQNDRMATFHLNLWKEAVEKIKREVATSRHDDMFAVVRDEADVPAHPGVLL